MIARDFRAVEKNTLRGFFTLDLDSGITLFECALHERGDKSWISLPSKPQIDGELRHRTDPTTGKRLYTPVVEFRSKAIREKFMAQALVAVEALRGHIEQRPAAAAAANSGTRDYGPDNYPRGVERASAPKAAQAPADELPNDRLPW